MMHISLAQITSQQPPTQRVRGRRRTPQWLRPSHGVHMFLATLFTFWWESQISCALYLNPQQQQQLAAPQAQSPMQAIISNQQQVPELGNNGAIIQALGQFAAQQVAGGGLAQTPGGLQVTATSSAAGAININNNGLVSGNQTGVVATGQQQGNGNQFVIKWIHNDPKNQMAYVSITPVNYTNLHEPRIELRYQSKYSYVSLAESSPNKTVVAAVIVNDEDSGPNGETSLSIEQGNELGHFKLVSTGLTNTIQVNGAPLSRQRQPEYNLTIVARDHGSPPKSSSSNLVIKLNASPVQSPHLGPIVSPFPQPHQSTDAPVTDLMYFGTMLVVMFSAVIILIIIGCALVQRPHKAAKAHKGPSSTRTTSATNSRIVPPTDQCSAYCLSPGYNLTNL